MNRPPLARLPGLLLSFEGIDGSGKTTQISLLTDSLRRSGHDVRVYREPGGTTLSERIRNLLLDPAHDPDPVTEILLFSAARSELATTCLLPDLQAGRVVILDRFFDSTTAYQGYGHRVMDESSLESIHRLAAHGLVPTLTFYLRIPLDRALRRLAAQEKDRIESNDEAFFERVIDGYDRLAARHERFITLDGREQVERIHQRILSEVDPHLPHR